jgi:3-phenylpropionate/trans-cinnamate dioxygenase ferredoxin subunit
MGSMEFIEIAKTGDIADGAMKAYKLKEKDILLVKVEGSYFAIGAKCTHLKGDLSKGGLEGKIVTCPLHGSKFDVTTGECISGPKIGFLKLKAKNEPVYTVKIEGGSIMVGI